MSHEEIQTLEQLSQRYSSLNDQRIRAQTNLENAQAELAKLEQQALEAFGTSDLEELKNKLQTMESENQKRMVEYQRHLDSIESDLAKVETEFAKVTDR